MTMASRPSTTPVARMRNALSELVVAGVPARFLKRVDAERDLN